MCEGCSLVNCQVNITQGSGKGEMTTWGLGHLEASGVAGVSEVPFKTLQLYSELKTL